MPGRQLNIASRGMQYESFFESLFSEIATVVRVPRAYDFGIDAYCEVKIPLDSQSSTTVDLFAVQVKGGDSNIVFGGRNKGEWKRYEIDWLRTLSVPLYLARVDKKCTRVDFYSLWPIWLVLWKVRLPYKMVCSTLAPSEVQWQFDENMFVKYVSAKDTHNDGFGDNRQWNISLGPPFLSLTMEKLRDDKYKSKVTEMLLFWMNFDRQTLIRYRLGIAVIEAVWQWTTNVSPTHGDVRLRMGWSQQPSENITELAKAIEPPIVNLGVNLQWQHDMAAYKLIPVLEWLESRSLLSIIGNGLLQGLRTTKERGETPGPNSQ